MVSDEALEDVPYGEDFHDPATAQAWAEAVGRKRPWRPVIFDHFVDAIARSSVAAPRVLELGSGPGFLAENLLDRCPAIANYTLLDFSDPMLSQSRQRLAQHAARTTFIRDSFKEDSWPSAVNGPFDFIVSLQAVHELRHKRHAPKLYAQVRAQLTPAGEFLVCDHLPEAAHTPRHVVLYMSIEENLRALSNAGFSDPRVLWNEHNMALYRASNLGPKGELLAEVGGLVDKTTVTLALHGADLNPDELSTLLKCTPTSSYRRGDARSRHSSHLPPRENGAWLLQVNGFAPTDPVELISGLLDRLPSDAALWAELRGRFRVRLWLGLFLDAWNRGFTLPADVLTRVANVAESIEFDIWSHSDDEEQKAE